MQPYGNSIQSRRKFRVQPLAGEPEKNVIRDGPLVSLWKPGHSVANIGLGVAIYSYVNRSTHISPIIVFYLKAFRIGKYNECVVSQTVLE